MSENRRGFLTPTVYYYLVLYTYITALFCVVRKAATSSTRLRFAHSLNVDNWSFISSSALFDRKTLLASTFHNNLIIQWKQTSRARLLQPGLPQVSIQWTVPGVTLTLATPLLAYDNLTILDTLCLHITKLRNYQASNSYRLLKTLRCVLDCSYSNNRCDMGKLASIGLQADEWRLICTHRTGISNSLNSI